MNDTPNANAPIDPKAKLPMGLVIFSVLSIFLLTNLGIWQMKRHVWKQGVKAQIRAQLKQSPVDLGKLLPQLAAQPKPTYEQLQKLSFIPVKVKVKVKGKTTPDIIISVARSAMGMHGKNIYAPIMLKDQSVILVDTGFLPEGKNIEILSIGKKSFWINPAFQDYHIGLLRPFDRKGYFRVEHQPGSDEFLWRDETAMEAYLKTKLLKMKKLLPMVIERLPPPKGTVRDIRDPRHWPWPLDPMTSISDRHLGYAITWFGLALTVLACLIGLIFKYRSPKDI